MYKINNTKKSKKTVIILAAVAVLFVASFAALEQTDTINLVGTKPTTAANAKEAKTTSDAPTAQPDFDEGDDRTPNVADKPSEAIVTNGDSPSSIPPESQWTTSANGATTVYAPSKDATITSGSTISGKTTANNVTFRLIDNVSGVIGQGQLTVTGGTFSGTFNFDTKATEGRLDIFSTEADGREINNVEIPVKF